MFMDFRAKHFCPKAIAEVGSSHSSAAAVTANRDMWRKGAARKDETAQAGLDTAVVGVGWRIFTLTPSIHRRLIIMRRQEGCLGKKFTEVEFV